MKIETTVEGSRNPIYALRVIDPDAGGYRCYTADEIGPPPPAPEPDVSMLAFRKALAQAGLRQAVEDYVNAAPLEVRDEWAQRRHVARDNPLVRAAAKALGVTDAQFAALWDAAVAIDVAI